MLQDWIPPGIVVAVMVFIWRDLKHDIRTINDRLDRHLEGHP